MGSKSDKTDSLIKTTKALVSHVDPVAAPINYIKPKVSSVDYVCPVIDIQLILDSKNKILADTIIVSSTINIGVIKGISDTVLIVNEIISLGTTKGIADAVTPVETFAKQFTKPFNDSAEASDQAKKHIDVAINSSLINSHAFLHGSDHEIVDNIIIKLN